MTLDDIPTVLVNGIGVVGAVFTFGWLLALGRLYTGRQVERIHAAHDAEMARMVKAHERELDDAHHERNEWRTEARLRDQAVAELAEQNRSMLDAFGPTLTDFLTSLRRAGVGPSNGEGDDP